MHHQSAIAALLIRLPMLMPSLGIPVENKHTIVRGLQDDKRGPQSGTAPREEDISVHLARAGPAVTHAPQSLADPWLIGNSRIGVGQDPMKSVPVRTLNRFVEVRHFSICSCLR